jgi:hypothetical protein
VKRKPIQLTNRSRTYTPLQNKRLNGIRQTLKEFSAYKPLTLRQVYYQLVAKGIIENSLSMYGEITRLLRDARIDGFIPWEDIEDRTKVFHYLPGWEKLDDFIEIEIIRFLLGYHRDLMQSQENHIEVWIEKDALSSIFLKVLREYGISLMVDKGFASIHFLNKYRDRVKGLDKHPVILYFGDWDPSGELMHRTIQETLEEKFDLSVEVERIALTADDIDRIPHDPDAIKPGDPRAPEFVKLYGNHAIELDALSPAELERRIREAVESYIDREVFNSEVKKQQEEAIIIGNLRRDLKGMIETYLDEHNN